MAGAKFIEHRGKRILFIDMSHCELDEIVHAVKETKKLISQQPLNSVFTLTDVRGTIPSSSITRVLKELTAFNKPYVQAGAIVGVDQLRKAVFAVVISFTGRNFSLFDEIEEAKNWLAQQ
ncbi:MAG: hypothetical protein NTV54_17120 [Ignavibacteriales bacterium]|nr:hypothetical protein [Ignavibacteriales bacterium]